MSEAVERFDHTGRAVLDVSGLPDTAFDTRSPVWWGNTLLIFIETTTLVLLLVTYFYLRRNFEDWPPPQGMTVPPMYHPVPDLPIPTAETVVILGSCAAMAFIDRAARRMKERAVKIGLWVMFGLTLAAIVLRFFEFPGVHFRWDENAYGSMVWVILGTHLTYLIAAAAEFFIMGLWVLRHPLDKKHALDVTLAGVYWYWVAATWVIVYATVYFGARVL